MKENRSLIRQVAACGAALAMVSTLVAQTPVEMGAKVVRIQGPARYSLSPGSGVWQPLKIGMILKPGAVVQTGKEPKSFVDLVFFDTAVPRPTVTKPGIPTSYNTYTFTPKVEQNVVRIWENSALGIDKLTAMQTGADVVTDTELDLKAGRLYFRVKKTAAASRYEVKIPNGIAGIRGSDGMVDALGIIQMFSGSAFFVYNDTAGVVQSRSVGPGQQCDISSGAASPGTIAPIPPNDPGYTVIPSMPPPGPTGGTTGGGSTVVPPDQTFVPVTGTSHENNNQNNNQNNQQ